MNDEQIAMHEAAKKLNDAERAFWRVIKDQLPVGHWVAWRHGGYWRTAEVLRHSQDRLFVRGDSGKEYWINWSHDLQLCP